MARGVPTAPAEAFFHTKGCQSGILVCLLASLGFERLCLFGKKGGPSQAFFHHVVLLLGAPKSCKDQLLLDGQLEYVSPRTLL